MNAVMKIEEIEDHRIEWEDHGWSADEMRFIVTSPAHKLEIKKARDTASLISNSDADDMRSKLDFSFLVDDRDEIPDWVSTVWYLNFPIDARTSREIVQTSMRVPKENIEALFFPLAPIEGPKKKFFEALVAFGRGCGLRVVGNELYAGAKAGDPRAVKMYFDMMGIGGDEAVDGDTSKLMRVELKF
jgi:hypothetical protein